jgi:tagaturonate reductase
MEPPILQFGTGRFLQAHVDLFVSQAQDAGMALGGITVVQSTRSPASTARTQALARADGFDVIVRGLVDGQPVETRTRCRSVREAFDAHVHWPLVRARARGPVRVIVSNTGDTGWQAQAGDGPWHLHDPAPAPASFPAKLLVLLHDRWRAAPELPPSVLPCELVSRNGDVLRGAVSGLAAAWGCHPDFVAWLHAKVVWANTLVDRIVSQALEPAGAVAEPYALWAIEHVPGLVLPCRHPAIVLTDDLEGFERRKLFLLNLGHTVLAHCWIVNQAGAGSPSTVLQAMHHASMRPLLEAVWQQEVLPVFDALGQGSEARTYLDVVRGRLLNPYLAHRLADIAQNQAQKKMRRIEPLVALAQRVCPALAQPRLRAVLAGPQAAAPRTADPPLMEDSR